VIPAGAEHFVGFGGHPRLFETRSGRVVDPDEQHRRRTAAADRARADDRVTVVTL
jgi:hypothetical protein